MSAPRPYVTNPFLTTSYVPFNITVCSTYVYIQFSSYLLFHEVATGVKGKENERMRIKPKCQKQETREHGKELSHYSLWAKIQYGGQNVITLFIQITTLLDLLSQNNIMSQNFYSVALAVLAAILVRWCVSLSSYSGKIISCLISLS